LRFGPPYDHSRFVAYSEVSARSQRWLGGYSSPYSIAVLYAGLGDKDAIQWLTAAYQERDINLERLKGDPLLDPVRSDARFPELEKKVGQP
jgi:hypothetical protein